MIKVLFICFANICRSPALQAIFESCVDKASLSDKIFADSCSLSPHYMGKDVDPRMSKALQKKGYKFSHISRPFKDSDFDEFDYIIPVTSEQVVYLESMSTDEKFKKKIHLAADFSPNYKGQDIADPYSMTEDGFDVVVEIAEDIAHHILEAIKKKDLK